MKDRSEKNPLFIPALIATLIPFVIFVFLFAVSCYTNAGGHIYLPDALGSLLIFLVCVAPFASIILSVAGLVGARKLQEPFIGCLCCLISTLLEVSLLFVWLSSSIYNMHENEVPIVSRSLTPEESASIESINEEIERAINGDTVTRTTK